MLVTELLGVCCRERLPAPPFVPVSTRTEDEGSLPIRRTLKLRAALKRVSCHQRDVGLDSGVVDGSTVASLEMRECKGREHADGWLPDPGEVQDDIPRPFEGSVL